ncbi:MAG TPA: MEDS domain-containing protein [Gemmatimonadales bacterium]|nr:MEDS domain-containing protein [Gemmatimonadales bacterium]
MASWVELLSGAEPGEHVVQLYGNDDQLLIRNVSRYLAEGLRRGDGLVVIATPEHTRGIVRHLVEGSSGAALDAIDHGRLVLLDAAETLEGMLLDGHLDEAPFRSVVGEVIAAVRARAATGRVRAFGEIVSLLWEAGRQHDVTQLEQLWNCLLHDSGCSLYCAYRIDLFDPPGGAAALQPIVASHDHVFAGAGTLLSSGRTRA